MMWLLLLSWCPWLFLTAQQPVLRLPSDVAPERAGPRNLDFESGAAGQLPPQWELAQASRVAGYSAEVRREGCRAGSGCAVIFAGPRTEKRAEGALIQQFPAEPYQGTLMRLRAWVKLEGGARADRIRLLFTTDGEKSAEVFQQKGGGVASPDWTLVEAEGKIPWRADMITILVSVSGKGKAWIDDTSFEAVK